MDAQFLTAALLIGVLVAVAAIPLAVYFVVAVIAGVIAWGCFAAVACLGFLGIGLLSMSGTPSDAGSAFVVAVVFLGYFGATACAALCVRSIHRRIEARPLPQGTARSEATGAADAAREPPCDVSPQPLALPNPSQKGNAF